MRKVKFKQWIPAVYVLHGSIVGKNIPGAWVMMDTGCFSKEYTGEGYFHQWAHYADQDSAGPVAIVEQMDGVIVEVRSDNLCFIAPFNN